MKRHHRLGFGAERSANKTHFRLWAPSAAHVALQLQQPERQVELQRVADGWHELALDDIAPGTLYRYLIDSELAVPDPASRFNPRGPLDWSEVIDPTSFEWDDTAWRGRPWREAVIYELHTGTFTPQGTFAAIEARLPQLAALGISLIELMPVAAFGGLRGWGYDGVLPFAPHAAYGRPEDLKRLVQAAHRHGIGMLLDVVYNHFGPEGNYLPRYASAFFNPDRHTPWGAAIDFDGGSARHVRRFFIENALYWLEEYHFDGLRLDAVHAIHDASPTHFIEELAAAVSRGPARSRHIHLVLENADNEARRLRGGTQRLSLAQWNDDFHHAAHVLATRETDGYYRDFAAAPLRQLGRTLAEGFAFQGEPFAFADNAPRGEPSAELASTAFVNFLQNHDQVGNRACGERLSHLTEAPQLRALLAILLLAPQPPMLFMGEEYAAPQPFQFFCDYHGELGATVSSGRRNEFARFAAFRDEHARASIPDPNAPQTYLNSQLRWEDRERRPHSDWLEYTRILLEQRKAHVVPLIDRLRTGAATYGTNGSLLTVRWPVNDGTHLLLLANMQERTVRPDPAGARLLYCTNASPETDMQPWEVRLLQS